MKNLRLKEHQILIVQSVVLLCVITLVTGVVIQLHNRVTRADQTGAQDQSGPALGEIIDLTALRDRKGQSLAERIKGHSLAMIVLVGPNCSTCTAAKNDLRDLREQVGKPGIPYYVVMIPEGTETEKYFAYADSLKLEAEAFVWSVAYSKPPSALATMAVPSHLMVTNEGLLFNKWPGIPR